MERFQFEMDAWLSAQIKNETNPRRRDLLRKGLGHGTVEFLKEIWYPAIGNFNNLYPEWEVRDLNNRYRYLDLAYIVAGAKGCIEIQGFGSHARDIEAWRFKDLCMKQALLAIDDWLFLPIAYLSIKEDPSLCRQLVLSFVGKFAALPASSSLDWIENETVRFARRLMRPFDAKELAAHLQRSEKHARRILQRLVNKRRLTVVGGKQRYRLWQLPEIHGSVTDI